MTTTQPARTRTITAGNGRPQPGWEQHGACRAPGVDPRLFFPERGESGVQARRICALCPVRRECLAEALADTWVDGVWGGTNKRQRDRMRGLRRN